jgi:hypothetical protein
MKKARLALGLAAIFGLSVLLTTRAMAHEHVEVEGFELTVGWTVEPPLVGQLNGVELRIHRLEEGEEHSDEGAAAPVVGAEESLSLRIEYGGEAFEAPLRPVFGEEGAYTADIIPGREGVYTFHFFGSIEDTEVDVAVEVEEVRSSGEVTFPSPEAAGSSTTPPATWLALALGLVGCALGGAALWRRSGN